MKNFKLTENLDAKDECSYSNATLPKPTKSEI